MILNMIKIWFYKYELKKKKRKIKVSSELNKNDFIRESVNERKSERKKAEI